jgi:NADPH2:quinone reductase
MPAQSANRLLTSKAVTYKSLGGYEVVEFVERMVRAPAAGEVRIEVKAAAVNRSTSFSAIQAMAV